METYQGIFRAMKLRVPSGLPSGKQPHSYGKSPF